jgi:hypothetical protein
VDFFLVVGRSVIKSIEISAKALSGIGVTGQAPIVKGVTLNVDTGYDYTPPLQGPTQAARNYSIPQLQSRRNSKESPNLLSLSLSPLTI